MGSRYLRQADIGSSIKDTIISSIPVMKVKYNPKRLKDI
jgi:hypothetical protein